MNNAHAPLVSQIAAAIASVATTLVLLAAVVSLSEPQQSQLIAATASRQAAALKSDVPVAQANQARALATEAIAQ